MTLDRWESLSIRYQNKYVLLDDFDRPYVILNNQDDDYIKKSITKFKYSKLSLDHLIAKLESKPEVPIEFIDEIKEFYKDKKGVDTIPLSLREIKDVLFDMDLLIDFVKEKQIDWEIISIDELDFLLERKKKTLKTRANSDLKLEEMSVNALKFEAVKLEQELDSLIEQAEEMIKKIQGNDNNK